MGTEVRSADGRRHGRFRRLLRPDGGGFARQTGNLDLGPFYERFLAHVRPAGRILDAECGVGRDASAFARRGYEVVAFDASAEMVRLARTRVDNRAAVHLMRFEDLNRRAEFDAIWTCASLLHVPATVFSDVASRLAAALRPDGAWYMSFKWGMGPRASEGRLFVDHTEETLRNALMPVPVRISEVWISSDIRRDRKTERWLNLIAVR
jgi:SAM-dependent methyltransferase